MLINRCDTLVFSVRDIELDCNSVVRKATLRHFVAVPA